MLHVTFERNVLHIGLNRIEKRNAVSFEMMAQLEELLTEWVTNKALRIV